MITQKILALGKFSPMDLRVSVGVSTRKIDPEVESHLDGLWAVKMKNAKEKGLTCYNGISYRLNSLKQADKKLFLDFGTIDFKTRECLPEAPGYFDMPEEYYRNGCHTLATVKASDGKYLMVELSGKSMNANGIDFLGGIMETDTEMETGDDVFRSLYKELEEEGLIEQVDIKESYLKMLYSNAKTNIGFYFEVILTVSSDVLTDRFKERSKDADIKSLKVFSRADYIEMLNNHNINKQFIATVVEI